MEENDSVEMKQEMRIIDLTTQPEEPMKEQSLAVKTLLRKYGPKVKRSKTANSRRSCSQSEPIVVKSNDPATPTVEESKRPLSQKIRIRIHRLKSSRRRLKRQTSRALQKIHEDQGLSNSTMRHVGFSSRGRRAYTRTLVELIARVGSAPSAGGARAPLAGIIAHATGGNCTGFFYIEP